MRKTLLLIISLSFTAVSFSQEKFWKFENELSAPKNNLPQSILPKSFRTVSLSFDQYKIFLNASPEEAGLNIKKGLEISLPYPDNSFKRFKIVETEMMEKGLAAQFPSIKTFLGQGIDDPSSTVRIDYTNLGFHAYVISPDGTLFIDPYQKANTNLYITYFSKDYKNSAKENMSCKPGGLIRSRFEMPLNLNAPLTGACIGTKLRTYRLAISCTGEYAIAVCPAGNVTVANTLSAMVTTMNRVNGVYQTELDIKMILVAANASIVYINPAADPYTGNGDGSILIDESQANITSVIGSGNFDIGHTFSTGAGGSAFQGVVCNSFSKARGVTGLTNPTGDAYDIDYVAHEMGHQFGASHTFESETNLCGNGNRIPQSAYEPGGGTTIMSYSGLCGSDNIQPNSNAYFHTRTFDEIVSYTTAGTGSTCPVVTSTGNNPPVIIMPASGIKIPKGTPFTLTATATDADGDSLTYSWEEWDITGLGTGSAWNSGATSPKAPLFRSRIPKTSSSRTFPDIAVILANYPSNPPPTLNGLKGETLPQIARDINFRLTARDNKATGGGVATGGDGCSSSAAFKVVVTNDGPFKISAPNTAVNLAGGAAYTVAWDAANTNDAAGINLQKVDILMSTDGGFTYPATVFAGAINDGSQAILVPNIDTNNTVRFMVKASGSIFFDISDVNFTITYNPLLLNFSVKPNNSSILLTWSTPAELNNKGFQILRSEGNSSNFITIGFVGGAGNSNIENKYTWDDSTVKKDVEYFYRLQQIDIYNNSTYSPIEEAMLTAAIPGKFILSLQPNPLSNAGILSIDGIQKKNFTLIISDMMGRIISRKDISNDLENRVIPLNIGNYSSGVYLVKVIQENTKGIVKLMKL